MALTADRVRWMHINIEIDLEAPQTPGERLPQANNAKNLEQWENSLCIHIVGTCFDRAEKLKWIEITHQRWLRKEEKCKGMGISSQIEVIAIRISEYTIGTR